MPRRVRLERTVAEPLGHVVGDVQEPVTGRSLQRGQLGARRLKHVSFGLRCVVQTGKEPSCGGSRGTVDQFRGGHRAAQRQPAQHQRPNVLRHGTSLGPPDTRQIRQRGVGECRALRFGQRLGQRSGQRVDAGRRFAVDLAEIVQQAQTEQPVGGGRRIRHAGFLSHGVQRRARHRQAAVEQRGRPQLQRLIGRERRAVGLEGHAAEELQQRVALVRRRQLHGRHRHPLAQVGRDLAIRLKLLDRCHRTFGHRQLARQQRTGQHLLQARIAGRQPDGPQHQPP